MLLNIWNRGDSFVRYYGWKEVLLSLLLHPQLFVAFLRLPRRYSTLNHWLEIDEIKCTIVAKAIGCKCAHILWEQQRYNMEFRKLVSSSFAEWMIKKRKNPSLSDPIDTISKEFAIKEKCHRKYRPPRAGVYCYCNTHNH